MVDQRKPTVVVVHVCFDDLGLLGDLEVLIHAKVALVVQHGWHHGRYLISLTKVLLTGRDIVVYHLDFVVDALFRLVILSIMNGKVDQLLHLIVVLVTDLGPKLVRQQVHFARGVYLDELVRAEDLPDGPVLV